MKIHKHFQLMVILMTLSLVGYSQEYILNEDFSTASGTTPPSNWQNLVVAGQPEAVWHYDNPGEPDGIEPLFTESKGIRVYSNPTSGDFTLEVMDDLSSTSLLVNVYGVWGEKVVSRTITGKGKNILSLSGKPNGIYFIRVTSHEGTEILKVVKR